MDWWNYSGGHTILLIYLINLYGFCKIDFRLLVIKFLNLIIFGLFCALLYTIPREKSKIRSKEIIHCAFYFSNDRQHYKFIALGHELTYLSSSTKRKAKSTTQKMIWSVCWSVLIDNTFVEFGEHIVQQIIVIPMGTKCCRYFPILI